MLTRRPAFAIFALTQALSIVGSRMSGIAIGFAVYAATGKTAPLLLFSLLSELPAMLLGSLAGVLVDRMENRLACALADAGQAVGSLALLLAFLSGHFELWMLYAAGTWQGFFAMLQSPAKDALVARLLPDTGRDRANALLAFSFPAAGILAPALGGGLYALAGVGAVVAVDLGSFCLALAAILFLPAVPAHENDAGSSSMAVSLRELFSFLRARRRLLLLVGFSVVLNFLLNGPLELAQPYTLVEAGGEIGQAEATAGGSVAVGSAGGAAGLALSLMAAGGAAGSAFWALRGRPRSRIRTVLLGAGGTGLFMMAAAVLRGPFGIGLALFCALACLQVWVVLTGIFQASAPLALQGRLSAFVGQAGYLGATASFALTGPLVDLVLEPARRAGNWSPLVAALVGRGPGASMALAIGAAGLLILLSALLFGPGIAHRDFD